MSGGRIYEVTILEKISHSIKIKADNVEDAKRKALGAPRDERQEVDYKYDWKEEVTSVERDPDGEEEL